jgi:hypothetical protein
MRVATLVGSERSVGKGEVEKDDFDKLWWRVAAAP